MTEFNNYTKILLLALQNNPKFQDVVDKKQAILDSVYSFHNMSPESTLFIGFNPAILSTRNQIFVTAIDEDIKTFLNEKKVKFQYIDWKTLKNYNKKFDSVVAFDEFFTFAETDVEQQKLIEIICDVAAQVVISTIKDYKNQDFKDREFSIPALIRNSKDNKIFLEFHDWNIKDRACWTTTCFEINNPVGEFKQHGPFNRRTMYFKQLAKFSHDAGSTHFQVHKNLMYKSPIKKNYEHVISIIFE
jgi:hypothetical protein